MIKLIDVYHDRKASIDYLYLLLKERTSEVNISHKALPTIQQHRKFIFRRPYRLWYLIKVNEHYVGSIYATQRNELGVFIEKQYQREGYGTQAMQELFRTRKPLPAISGVRNGSWVANINPENTKSIAFFTSLGFNHVSDAYVKTSDC